MFTNNISMTNHSSPPSTLRLLVAKDSISMFTTVLQAGIEIKTVAGEAIGVFLEKLPGFTEEYITTQVQTIFLNGTATDDLETPLPGDHPVLAISAAMPGLAGAIFRKNSLHAALRTTKQPHDRGVNVSRETTVTLKLFNTIARDRGARLLHSGVIIKTGHLQEFLKTRPKLFEHLRTITFADRLITPEGLATCLAEQHLLNLIVGIFDNDA